MRLSFDANPLLNNAAAQVDISHRETLQRSIRESLRNDGSLARLGGEFVSALVLKGANALTLPLDALAGTGIRFGKPRIVHHSTGILEQSYAASVSLGLATAAAVLLLSDAEETMDVNPRMLAAGLAFVLLVHATGRVEGAMSLSLAPIRFTLAFAKLQVFLCASGVGTYVGFFLDAARGLDLSTAAERLAESQAQAIMRAMRRPAAEG